MLVVTRWIFSIALIGGLLGCAGPRKPKFQGPASQVYISDYDLTWRAAQKAMLDYPLKINNIDAGVIETDLIKGEELWKPPFKAKRRNPGLRYNIKLVATEGKRNGKAATRVRVYKKTTLEKDFFSGKKDIGSDGFEEQSILYRIEREIEIEKALERAYRTNQI